jgi:hypothetical protein
MKSFFLFSVFTRLCFLFIAIVFILSIHNFFDWIDMYLLMEKCTFYLSRQALLHTCLKFFSGNLALALNLALNAAFIAWVSPSEIHMMADSSETAREDTRDIDILLESSWGTGGTCSSVNQPPVTHGNPVASPGESVGPSNPPANPQEEEVVQPQNPQAPQPYNIYPLPPEPTQHDVIETIRTRLLIHRLGGTKDTTDEEVAQVFRLKGEILTRMSHISPNPCWDNHRMFLIRNFLTPPRGGEYSIRMLQTKLEQLHSENAEQSFVYKELFRAKDEFAPFL